MGVLLLNFSTIWDSHIHLDQYPKGKIPYYLEKWHNDGVKGLIAVATDLKSSYELLTWNQKYPNFVYPALGHHPEQKLPVLQDLVELLSLIQKESKNIVAIGEVGLIHYRQSELGVSELNGYMELLKTFAETAKRLNLPLILHAVHDKTAMVLPVLAEQQIKKVHFHWFKSSQDISKQLIEGGYTVSFTPEITFRDRDQRLAKRFPLEQILLETDGPWPLEGAYKNRVPEPIWIWESISVLARLKNVDENEVINFMNQNIQKLYF